jgi:hypothetical protein
MIEATRNILVIFNFPKHVLNLTIFSKPCLYVKMTFTPLSLLIQHEQIYFLDFVLQIFCWITCWKMIWWWKFFEMKIWNKTIYCPMSCSNGRKHAQTKGCKRSHATLRCWWKWKVLLSTCVKASKMKECWLTIKLTTMI